MKLKATPMERFLARIQIDSETGCWNWQGSIKEDGYGWIKIYGKKYSAHRLSFALSGQTLIAGLEIDHLCRNRRCVNPAHLEQVDHLTNTRRGSKATATHCKRGHPFDGTLNSKGRRRCHECQKQDVREYMRRKRQEPEFRQQELLSKREYRKKAAS